MSQHLNPVAGPTVRPAVTVVLPTYNRAEALSRAVESVRRQTYDDWELVIVDDASSEDMAASVAPMLEDCRVRLVQRTVNGGASAARNSGLQEARGRFVCFLDDDDEFTEHKLAHQVPQLESAPDDVAGVAGAHIGPSGPMHERPGGPVVELRREELLSFDVWFVQIGSVLLRREAAVEIGFDESLPVIQDWDLYVRLLERHRMLRDSEPMVLMHDDADGRLTSDRWNRLRDLERLYDKYRPEISQDRRLDATWHGKMAIDALEFGYGQRARQHAVSAVRLAPTDPRRWYLLGTAVVGPTPRRWLMTGYRRLSTLRRRLGALWRRV